MAIVEQISDAIKGQRTRAFLSDGENDVLFSVTLSKSQTEKNEITRHAIEEGSDVTDHIIEKPGTLSFVAVLSDNDLSLDSPQGFFNETIQDRLDLLNSWKLNKPILTYYGHETDVENVVIESVKIVHAIQFGSGLQISIDLKKINIVKTQIVEIQFNVVTRKGKTPRKTDSKKSSASSKAPQEKSWLAKLVGSR